MPDHPVFEDPWHQMAYKAFNQAAEDGVKTPTGEDLRQLLGCSALSTTVKVTKDIEKSGAIQVERYQRERRVTIVATGKSTAQVKTPAPHWRTRPRPSSMPSISPTYLETRRAKMGDLFVKAAREEGLSVQDFIAELVWAGWQHREESRA